MSRIRFFYVPVNFRSRNYEVAVREFEDEKGEIQYKISSPNEAIKTMFPEQGMMLYRSGNTGAWKCEHFDQATEDGVQKENVLQEIIACLEELS